MTDICNKATDMRLQWRDMEMAERSREMYFILCRREGDDIVEDSEQFK